MPNIKIHELFESGIYLIARRDDPLAQKNLITESDLYGRTLMVSGGSPPALKAVQHRLIATGKITYFNIADHDTTLTILCYTYRNECSRCILFSYRRFGISRQSMVCSNLSRPY